jgi:hypothetical protein
MTDSKPEVSYNFLAVWTKTLGPGTKAVTAWPSLVSGEQEFFKTNSRDKSWQRPRQCVPV